MPKPDRKEVLPSPKTSQANPTPGPKSLWSPLPRLLDALNPPGPQTPAKTWLLSTETVLGLQVDRKFRLESCAVLNGTLALAICSAMPLPGPSMNVVAKLFSS